MLSRKRKIIDTFLRFLIYLCAGFSVVLLVGIILYVLVKGLSTVSWSFLTSVTSVLNGTVGIAGNIVNTILIVLMTMVVAIPIGVGSAIYLNEYAKPGKIVTLIEYATETLSGIPSIIFGLFGMMFFGEKLGFGYSLLTGSLTLILMVLPLITRNTQEALKTVPDMYRNGAYGLGSGKWHMIRTILIPSAACRNEEFIGHIGGDDFVVISNDYNLEEVFSQITDSFHQCLEQLYSKEDYTRGEYCSKNRHGEEEIFPLASISGALYTNENISVQSMNDFSYKIALTKKEGKQHAGDYLQKTEDIVF